MRISFSSLVQYSLFLLLPLAEAKKCTKSRLSSARTVSTSSSIVYSSSVASSTSISVVGTSSSFMSRPTSISISATASSATTTTLSASISKSTISSSTATSTLVTSISKSVTSSLTASTTQSTSSSSATSSSSSTTLTSASPIVTTTISVTVSSSTSTSAFPIITTTVSVTVSGSTTSSSITPSATSTVGPVVTNQAYIDTIIRHHNAHRTNHSAAAVVWSSSLADTARIIASSCVYRHNTTVHGGGYGQNIGAGFAATAMGQFVTEALYNGEVNAYTYYGGEPDVNTVGQWGHFSQIVWKGTSSVGCYTYDCSSAGLQNAVGIPPEFTVCNYAPAGNVLGSFNANVSPGLGAPTIDASYECPSRANCAN
ncbi:putative CAP domain-containing protein [Seiridium cardinale]